MILDHRRLAPGPVRVGPLAPQRASGSVAVATWSRNCPPASTRSSSPLCVVDAPAIRAAPVAILMGIPSSPRRQKRSTTETNQ